MYLNKFRFFRKMKVRLSHERDKNNKSMELPERQLDEGRGFLKGNPMSETVLKGGFMNNPASDNSEALRKAEEVVAKGFGLDGDIADIMLLREDVEFKFALKRELALQEI